MSAKTYLCNEENVDCYIIAFNCVKQRLKLETKFEWPDCPDLPYPLNPECARMVDLCETIEKTNPICLKFLSQILGPVSRSSDFCDFSRSVRPLFYFGISWKQIVTLFTFGNYLAVQCFRAKNVSLIIHVAQWVAIYAENHLSDFLEAQNGWNGLFSETVLFT